MVLASSKMKVVVTGAGGRTGQLVAKRLAADPAYEPVAVVRDDQVKAARAPVQSLVRLRRPVGQWGPHEEGGGVCVDRGGGERAGGVEGVEGGG